MADAKTEMHPADVIVPTHEVFEARHLLSLPDEVVSADEKAKTKSTLLELIDRNNMGPFYLSCCTQFGWEPDTQLVNRYKELNDTKLSILEKALDDAKNQYGDVEIKDARLRKANHLCTIGAYEEAKQEYEEVLKEKATESGGKVDIYLTFVRIGLFTDDAKLAEDALERAERQMESGGDWERRNRIRIYKAFHLAKNYRNLADASELLLSGLATFTASELLTFKHFVTVTVLLTMCSLPRPKLKSEIATSPEVMQVFGDDTVLGTFFNSFMNCNYRQFFITFGDACDRIRRDRYLKRHYRYFVRNMRLIAYKQYLEPFKSVTLPAMASSFGVREEFIEEEVVNFIASGKLHCRIDRVSRTIDSNNSHSQNDLFQSVVKSGDALINRIQMLSRVIDL